MHFRISPLDPGYIVTRGFCIKFQFVLVLYFNFSQFLLMKRQTLGSHLYMNLLPVLENLV